MKKVKRCGKRVENIEKGWKKCEKQVKRGENGETVRNRGEKKE